MSIMRQPDTKIRFDTKAQKDKFIRAAKLRRWSLNTLMLVATEGLAEDILKAGLSLSEIAKLKWSDYDGQNLQVEEAGE